MPNSHRTLVRIRIIGIALLVLGIFTVGQAVYFTAEDRAQRECMRDNFAELNRVFKVRAEANERESQATEDLLQAFATAAESGPDALNQDVARSRIVRALSRYDRERERIDRERAQNPIPDFPPGECSQ